MALQLTATKGPSRALAAGVDGARHQFLAGARLAAHQHRRHAARHLLHQRAHLLHGRRVAGQPAERLARRRGRRRRGRAVAAAAPAARPCCSDGRVDGTTVGPLPLRPSAEATTARNCLQVDRLGEVVEGAGLERLDRVLGRAVGRHHDAPSRAGRLARACCSRSRPDAVGQAHVGDDGARSVRSFRCSSASATRAGGLDVVALAQQGQLVQRAQVGLVVDDEQAEVRGVWS